jgi:ribosomal protein L6P/L9E
MNYHELFINIYSPDIAMTNKKLFTLLAFITAVTLSAQESFRFGTSTNPDGITFEVPNPNTIVVKGINKQAVGQIAAVIRGKRPPEPYHGKGVKYSDEHIRRKAGKAGK